MPKRRGELPGANNDREDLLRLWLSLFDLNRATLEETPQCEGYGPGGQCRLPALGLPHRCGWHAMCFLANVPPTDYQDFERWCLKQRETYERDKPRRPSLRAPIWALHPVPELWRYVGGESLRMIPGGRAEEARLPYADAEVPF
jgi:hypothetical protein